MERECKVCGKTHEDDRCIDTDDRITPYEEVLLSRGYVYVQTRRAIRGGVREYRGTRIDVDIMQPAPSLHQNPPPEALQWWVGNSEQGKMFGHGIGTDALIAAIISADYRK